MIPTANERLIIALAIGLVMLYLARYGLLYVSRYTVAVAAQQLVYSMAQRLFENVQRLSLRFYERNGTGDIISRATSDVGVIQQAVTGGVVNGIVGLVNMLAYAIVMLVSRLEAGAAGLRHAALDDRVSYITAEMLRSRYMTVRETMSSVNSVLAENITGVRVAKAFAQEVASTERFQNRNRENLDANMSTASVQAVSLRHYLPFEGMLAGDPHMGNFGVLPLRTVAGARQMKFVNIDFDDAGRGPFVLDFIHCVVSSKAVGGDVKRRFLEEAYLNGLAGKEIAPPKKVKHLLEMSVSDYDDMVAQYAETHSSTDGFVFKVGKIESYNARIARSTIEALFAARNVIDLAIRPRDRGGSVDELRIWILIEGKNARRRIMELKQYAKPATAIYQPQPSVKQWLSEIRRVFWPGLDGSDYDLVNLAGDGRFWVREKHVSLIDVPYSSEKDNQIAFRDELATYDANQLGLAHGRQAQAEPYCAVIKADTEAFHNATEEVEKAYLELAQQAFDQRLACQAA